MDKLTPGEQTVLIKMREALLLFDYEAALRMVSSSYREKPISAAVDYRYKRALEKVQYLTGTV